MEPLFEIHLADHPLILDILKIENAAGEALIVECPHSLSCKEDRELYLSKLAACYKKNLIPLLAPQASSIQEKEKYAPYARFYSSWDKEVEDHKNGWAQSAQLNVSEALIGLFTSGSTGTPKLIWHDLSHYRAAAKRSAELLNMSVKSVVLTSLPCYHNGGFLNLIRSLIYRHPLHIVSHKELTQEWKQLNPDIVIGVPTQLQLALEADCTRSGQKFYCGGAALNENLWNRALDNDLIIYGTYGLTESCGAILYKQTPEAGYRAMQDVFIESKGSEKNRTLSFTCPSSALAFQREATIHYHQGPWKTSDLIEFNSAGQILIKGRNDQMIICSGENIDPREIYSFMDCFLQENKLISTILVMGLPDPVKGQIPVVVIDSLEHWSEVQLNSLKTYLRSVISPLKRPRYILPYQAPKKGIKLTADELLETYREKDLKKWRV